MLLTNVDLRIRNAEGSDARLLCLWWNDGEVMAHAGFPNGLGTTSEAISNGLAKDCDDTRRRLILECDNVPIGEMSYRNLGDKVAEIGIKICNSSMQGRGLGSRFIGMLVNELFSLGYNKIALDTNLKNIGAQHVYEKLGFKRVGIRIDCWTDQLGRLQSAVDYELDKS